MLSGERRNEIRQIMRNEKSVSVEDLAARFGVSPSTVRRDLDRMADDGMIRRTYGGAFLMENLSSELPISLREHENTDAKHAIARAAVRLIRDGDTIILDTSSTVTAMVPLLREITGLTVVTNGIKTAYLLNSDSHITTVCTGGRLREHNMSLVGVQTVARLHEINADIAFLSCRGLHPERGVTEASEEEAEVKKAMIDAASRTVLLCDSTKIGMVLMNRVCPVDRLYAVITDRMPDDDTAHRLTEAGVQIITL